MSALYQTFTCAFCLELIKALFSRQLFMQLVSQRLKAWHCSCTSRCITLCNGPASNSQNCDQGKLPSVMACLVLVFFANVTFVVTAKMEKQVETVTHYLPNLFLQMKGLYRAQLASRHLPLLATISTQAFVSVSSEGSINSLGKKTRLHCT